MLPLQCAAAVCAAIPAPCAAAHHWLQECDASIAAQPCCKAGSVAQLACCLQAVIDQVDGIITFDADTETQLLWDEQISSICAQLNAVVDASTGGIQAH